MKIDCQLQIHRCEISFMDGSHGSYRIDGAIHPLGAAVSSPPQFHTAGPIDPELGDLIRAHLEKIFGQEIARKGES